MGGGGRYHWPKDIWAPTGGAWPNPRNWRRNTAIAAVGLTVMYAWLLRVGTRHDVHPHPPRKAIPWKPWLKPVPIGEDPYAPENQINYLGEKLPEDKQL